MMVELLLILVKVNVIVKENVIRGIYSKNLVWNIVFDLEMIPSLFILLDFLSIFIANFAISR